MPYIVYTPQSQLYSASTDIRTMVYQQIFSMSFFHQLADWISTKSSSVRSSVKDQDINDRPMLTGESERAAGSRVMCEYH